MHGDAAPSQKEIDISEDATSKDRHSKFDEFEPIPDGWELKHDLGGWYCPNCIKEYDTIIEAFKNKKYTKL